MPMEGFYVFSNAFPWGLLALLSIEEGQLRARVARFLPRGDAFSEVLVPLFEVSVQEEHGNIRRGERQRQEEWRHAELHRIQ